MQSRPPNQAADRLAREAEALRRNLKLRKQQERARIAQREASLAKATAPEPALPEPIPR